ncbi:MAG: VTT domain-containing protein, partial [Chloroflexota bacterium]
MAVIEGPIVTIVAGFLASLGYFNALIIYILAILGDLIGDTLYYVLGRRGNEYLLARKKFLWINIEQLKALTNHFDKHLGKSIILGKWTHVVGAPILIAAGMARVSFKKFILFNIIGTAPKILVFLIIGYYFGQAYKRIDAYLEYAAVIIFFIII